MSGALLAARFQQQSRARSPFKPHKGDFNPARGAQGVPAPAAPGGSGCHKGLRVLFSRAAPGNLLCIQEVSVPFLPPACHKNQHFLGRKGAHRAGSSGRRLEQGIEMPPAPCQLSEQPLGARAARGWGRQGSGTRLGPLPGQQVLQGAGATGSSTNPAWIRGFGAQQLPAGALRPGHLGEGQEKQLSWP